MSSLVLIYCLLFTLLAYKRINIGIYIVVATLPSYLIRFSFFNIPMTLLEAMILILFLIWLYKNNFSYKKLKQKIPAHKILYFIIALIIATAILSVKISPNTLAGLGILKAYFIEPILFCFIIITSSKKETPRPLAKGVESSLRYENLFWALGISAIYISIMAIWQKFTGWNMPEIYLSSAGGVDRVVSIFNYPNALGLYLGPIIILFTGFWLQGRHRVLKLLVIILSLITIVLAKSEGAIISVLLIWLIWLLIYKKTRKYGLIIIIISLILILAIPTVRTVAIKKITFQDYSLMVRKLIWQESWQMLKNNPITGAGLAGYQTKIRPYHLPTFEIFLYPHNIILNFWSELGILGLMSFIWLMGWYFYNGFKNKKTILTTTLLLVMAQIIIHGLIDVPYFKNDLSVLFWIIIAILIINLKHDN